ncbi:MAG: Methyl-accepting chemotaxis protein 4 [Chlamydiae bacterium]|nr:Methyl-accepting chemotaxis protein 4 [Chlamydiota bacterium]
MKKTIQTNPNQDSWMNNLTQLLTNHQKYYLMILIVAAGFGIVIYGLVVQINSQYSLINDEIRANEMQRPLISLYENIDKHHILLGRYVKGDRTVRNEIRKTQTIIQQDVKVLQMLQKEYSEVLEGDGRIFLNRSNDPIQLSDIQSQWDVIQKKALVLTSEKSHEFHQKILGDLSAMIKQLEEAINPDNLLKMTSFFLTEAVVHYFPQQVDSLTQLNRLIENNPGKLPEDARNQIISLLVYIKSNYYSVKDFTEKAINEIGAIPKYREIKQDLQYNFSNYESVMERYFLLIDQLIYEKRVDTVNYVDEGTLALSTSFGYWKQAENALDKVLKIRLGAIFPREYILLFISLFITFLGVYFGRFFVKMVVRSVDNLDKGYRRLNRGELTTRVPVMYEDEIGRASMGFNLMAETFEALIAQMRNVFDATKRLSEGDFSIRVKVDDGANEEIQQLALSFNIMAQSFEEIVSQVNRLGINLTSSSKEIFEATREHEASSKNQELTTNEILGISIEISSNAKEFAKTIQDVTNVVEQTASLANKGRESLNQMEAIMRQMVDASADIASKLGILNDKAGNINSVITTITNVADQINLLSLNAAIIADKAGEDGRSFSVIAGEIRDLADQTALATLDIDSIVDEMMSAVSSSVMGVDDFIQEIRNGVSQNEKVAEHLSEIIERVQALAPRFELVNEGMQIQYDASEQINEAITKLSRTAHTTAESMHQFAITTNELNESAVYLKNAVANIIEVKG